jgi:hypothetical protein
MRFTNLFQRETDRLLKSFLDDNPDVLQKYVDGSLVAISAILGPINVFMRHLLTVQGLDPDSIPGEKQRLLIQEAMGNLFNKNHEEAFDPDYNLDWVQQKFEETRGKLNQLGLTKEKFMDLTDLSRLPNIGRVTEGPVTIDVSTSPLDELSEINQIAPEFPKKEIPLVSKEQERENKKESPEFDPRIELGGDAIQALREALLNLEKNLELSKDKKKKGVKVSKKKMNKTTSKPLRVKRVPVKSAPLPEVEEEKASTLKVESNHKEAPPWKKTPSRSLTDLASKNRARVKAAKEATPEFQARLKARIARATNLVNIMVEKGLVDADEKSRQDQITSMSNWADNNFDALERVVTKYGPTKDAVAENKFKGSFRRVQK